MNNDDVCLFNYVEGHDVVDDDDDMRTTSAFSHYFLRERERDLAHYYYYFALQNTHCETVNNFIFS